jgi:hypothetical protein
MIACAGLILVTFMSTELPLLLNVTDGPPFSNFTVQKSDAGGEGDGLEVLFPPLGMQENDRLEETSAHREQKPRVATGPQVQLPVLQKYDGLAKSAVGAVRTDCMLSRRRGSM